MPCVTTLLDLLISLTSLGNFLIRTKRIIDVGTSRPIAEVNQEFSSMLDCRNELIYEPEVITEPAGVVMENIIIYIGGFLVRKLKKKANCEHCHNYLIN